MRGIKTGSWSMNSDAQGDVHYGTANTVREKRAAVLDTAYQQHPERFVRNPPQPPKLPDISWINKPNDTKEDTH